MEIPQSKNNFHCENPIGLFFGKDHHERPIAVAMQESQKGKFGLVFHYNAKGKPYATIIEGGFARCPEKAKLKDKGGKLAFVDRHIPKKGENFNSYIVYGAKGSQKIFPMAKEKEACLRGDLGIRIGSVSPAHKF